MAHLEVFTSPPAGDLRSDHSPVYGLRSGLWLVSAAAPVVFDDVIIHKGSVTHFTHTDRSDDAVFTYRRNSLWSLAVSLTERAGAAATATAAD